MGVNATAIVGSGKERQSFDFYPTPREVTISLLDFLHIPENETIWEPACGQGHMVEVMRERGYDVVATDIQSGTDFLTADLPQGVKWIITNPPFKVSERFIKRCLHHKKPFALLLKSQYWHAARRQQLFATYPPKFVLPLTWRPDFTGQGSSLMDVCWCVWDDNYGLTFSLYKPLAKPKSDKP